LAGDQYPPQKVEATPRLAGVSIFQLLLYRSYLLLSRERGGSQVSASNALIRKLMNAPTPDELEKAIEDIGYVILQACLAHDLYFVEVIPVLRRTGISEETIKIANNASLESQLLFLRKLNEFFEPLPVKKEDDLRAEHYFGFKSRGPFLRDQDEAELHKRIGHITLSEVRRGKKDWTELVKSYVLIAVKRSLEFFRFLRASNQLSGSKQEDVQFYVKTLERIKRRFNHQSAASTPLGESRP